MILILTQCFPPTSGGIEGLMGGLARELAAAGRKVLVLADAHQNSGEFDPTVSDLYAIRRFGGVKPLRRRLKARAAKKLILGGGVEGVFADSWKSLEMLDSAAVQSAGVPVIVWAHGNEYPIAPDVAKQKRIRSALSVASRVLANSRYTQQRVTPYAPDGLDIVVRHPPIDTPVRPSADDIAWAESLWSGGSPRLVSVSRLDPRKGLDSVIRCLPGLAAAHPDIRFVIAGPGDDRPRLEALAKELRVGTHVCFAGRVDGGRKSALYATADLFAMPTRPGENYAEGFGIVYVEAAYFGAPAIAGLAGGAPDAVLDGETGLLCDSTDATSVCEALQRALADPEALGRMSDAAKARAAVCVWPGQLQAFLDDAGGEGS